MSTINATQPCHCLRSKNPYGSTPLNADSWLPSFHSVTTYWCMRTMGPAGPDDHFVHLSRCKPGRPCYEERES
jgi:hypothetical protein